MTCVFFLDRWTRGRRVPRKARGTVPAMAHPAHQSPRAFPELSLLKDRLGIDVPGGSGSHLCFHLFFNSSFYTLPLHMSFLAVPLVFSPPPWEQGWKSGCAILGCWQESNRTPWSSFWVGHAPVYVLEVETYKNCPIQANCLSQLPPDLTFMLQNSS